MTGCVHLQMKEKTLPGEFEEVLNELHSIEKLSIPKTYTHFYLF